MGNLKGSLVGKVFAQRAKMRVAQLDNDMGTQNDDDYESQMVLLDDDYYDKENSKKSKHHREKKGGVHKNSVQDVDDTDLDLSDDFDGKSQGNSGAAAKSFYVGTLSDPS